VGRADGRRLAVVATALFDRLDSASGSSTLQRVVHAQLTPDPRSIARRIPVYVHFLFDQIATTPDAAYQASLQRGVAGFLPWFPRTAMSAKIGGVVKPG
jgi:hypothetical protein